MEDVKSMTGDYEVWKVKGGKLWFIAYATNDYDDAWRWIKSWKDSGSYVLRYFKK